jgi:hypothetical protein
MWYILYITVFCILLKALDEDLSKQKKALQDRINARKMKGQQKEEEEIEAYHLLMWKFGQKGFAFLLGEK